MILSTAASMSARESGSCIWSSLGDRNALASSTLPMPRPASTRAVMCEMASFSEKALASASSVGAMTQLLAAMRRDRLPGG